MHQNKLDGWRITEEARPKMKKKGDGGGSARWWRNQKEVGDQKRRTRDAV